MRKITDTSGLSLLELEELRRTEYATYSPLECSALDNERVYFTSAGFYHSMHKGTGAARNEADQRMRLNLLPRIRTVIRKATLAEVREQRIEIKGKAKLVKYYSLTLENKAHKKITVVLRRIGIDGKLQYYSVFYKN